VRDQVFISYSHSDQKWLQKLHTHLKPFERTHKIQVWDDTGIVAGTKWRDEIETALKEAKVAVLLVSPNYLASDFIAAQECPRLLAAAEAEGLKVIWVAVSASAYLETDIKDYQAANDPTRPLDCLKPAKLNEALVKICEAIRTAVDGTPADCDEPAASTKTQVRRSRARAAKPEQEATTPEAASPSQAIPASQAAPTPQPLERTPSATEETRRPPRFNNKLLFVVGGVILALVIGGIFVYSRLKDGATLEPKPAAQPLLTAEFNDEFLNLEKWTPPPAGWSINKSEGQEGRLFVDQPEVGFATDINCGDCEVIFDIKLLNNAGASWALRVNDPNNYYLFSLSGPDGPEYANRFISYTMRDGKRDPKSLNYVNLMPDLLKEGRNYHVEIKVEKNKITSKLEDTDGTAEDIQLGVFVDTSNTHPHGSVGFMALGNQKFSVDDLWVRPLGTQKPQ
jgi:TIR domain